MMAEKGVYQHFSKEDHQLIEQILEWVTKVEDQYSIEVTSFLNPHQVSIVENLGNKHDLNVFSSSTYFSTELSKVILAPAYYELDMNDFEMSLLEIEYPSKFHHLTHSQIMGTLIHHLGIERHVFGDILVNEGRAQIFVEQRFTNLFINQITKIAKVPVQLKKVSFQNRLVEDATRRTQDILVSSLRLDKLVATTFKVSRKDSSDLILSKQVKVNYRMVDNPSLPISIEDLVSVRKYGRFKVIGQNGFSKNGKHKLTVEILSSK